MISKEDCQAHLLKLIKNSLPKGPEALGQAIKDFFQFVADNANDMSPDAQELIPVFKEIAIGTIDSTLEATPDSPEKREISRKFKTVKKNLPLAISILADLEQKTAIEMPFIISTRNFFEKYCQILLDLLYEASEKKSKGIEAFATISLLFACVDELIISFHLAQHGYANQSYMHIRAVIEALDLIELFVRDKKYAEIWAMGTTKEKRKELSPSAVRKKLGDKKDAMYALFSQYGTHPTWDYATVKSAMSAEMSPKGNPLLKITIGGTKQVKHVLVSNVLCAFLLIHVLFTTLKVYENQFNGEDVSSMVNDFTKALRDYMLAHIIPDGKARGLDISDLEDILREGPWGKET